MRNRRERSDPQRILIQLFANAQGGRVAPPLPGAVASLHPAKRAAHNSFVNPAPAWRRRFSGIQSLRAMGVMSDHNARARSRRFSACARSEFEACLEKERI